MDQSKATTQQPKFNPGKNLYEQLAMEILDAVTEGTNVIIAAQDLEYRYTFINQAYKEEICRLTGKEIQVGDSMLEIFSHMPDQLKIAKEEWSQTMRGERSSKTMTLGDPGHYQKSYRILHTPIRDSGGKVVGAGEVAIDVSEEVQAKTALLDNEKRYFTLFNSMSEGFALHEIICDETGNPVDYRFLDINPAFEKLTGITREQVIGKTYNELGPDDSPLWVERYGKVALTGNPSHFENYSPFLKRYYEVFAYSPTRGQFATIFSDITERKQAEKSRNWLASFPERNPQIVAVVNFAGDITYLNPAGKKLFPDFQGNMYQHPFLSGSEDIMEKLRKEELDSISREVAVNNSWYKQTWLYLPEFECVRIYSMDITDRVNADLALQKANAILEEGIRLRTEELDKANQRLQSDIARRIQTETALLAEQRRFNDVLEILPAYLIILTPDYHVTFANRFFRENFGVSGGRRCHEYLFGRDTPCDDCETYRVMDTKKPHHWEWTGPNKHIYDVHDFPLADIDGSPLILEMGIDITDVKQAHDRLRNLNAYNRSLIEANLDTLVTITPDGKIGDVNAATETVTGYSREELIGTDFSIYFSEPLKAQAGFQEALKTGTVRDYELEIQHKDGRTTPVAYNASVYHDRAGQVAGVFAGSRDLTEFKKRQNQLLSLNKALEEAIEHEQLMHRQLVQSEKFAAMGRMLASITHEINNPLQTIKNCLYLVQEDIPSNSQAGEFLTMASTETERISLLVAELREVYRPRQDVQPKPFSLLNLLNEVHTLLKGQLQDGEVKWVQRSPVEESSSVTVNGVYDQIKQVFINLCINAIEAMQPAGGRLMIDIVPDENDCELGIKFQDTGPGIPPDFLAKIFEPFNSTKTKGLGLGLAICYDLVQRNSGRIFADSKPGQGATFEVWLKRSDLDMTRRN